MDTTSPWGDYSPDSWPPRDDEAPCPHVAPASRPTSSAHTSATSTFPGSIRKRLSEQGRSGYRRGHPTTGRASGSQKRYHVVRTIDDVALIDLRWQNTVVVPQECGVL